MKSFVSYKFNSDSDRAHKVEEGNDDDEEEGGGGGKKSTRESGLLRRLLLLMACLFSSHARLSPMQMQKSESHYASINK